MSDKGWDWEDWNRHAFLQLVLVELTFRDPRPRAKDARLAMWRAQLIKRSSLPTTRLEVAAVELVDASFGTKPVADWIKKSETAQGGETIP